MNFVSGCANRFIQKSLEEQIYVTPLKLNCLVYLLYSDYLFSSLEKLFNEHFIKTNGVPVLPTIDSQFGCFKNSVITECAKDATGCVPVVGGDFFNERFSCIWNRYKNKSDMEILTFVNAGSLFLRKENDKTIYDREIFDDELERYRKSLERVDYYRRKLTP